MRRIVLKKTLPMFIFLLLVAGLVGCAGIMQGAPSGTTGVSSESRQQAQSDIGQSGGFGQSDRERITGYPGSYLVPEGWIKATIYSTSSKYFYVEDGHENNKAPNNISVEIGKNRYSVDEHEMFRDAIVRQLTMQMHGLDAALASNGTYTDQGYVVYTFTISEPDMVTTQFYIVGDQRYCLIHVTNFTGSESVNRAAQTMVDNFTWE